MRYRNPSDQCKNLYRFIRLVLGDDISDREIARRWRIDEKNLRELKNGTRVVPKLAKLETLAEVLGVRKYYVVEAASGVPAEKVYHILRNSLLEEELQEVETIFRGTVPREKEKDRIRAGLRSAALLAHQTLDPEEIFRRVSRELKKFQFESHIFFLDPESGQATIRHSSFSPRLLHVAESLTGLSLTSFRFPVDRVPSFQTLIQAKSPVYLPDASVLLYQILGDRQLQRFIGKIQGMFRILEVVLTPITVRGEVRGVFATGQGGKLNEACLPDLRVFSEHLSCSFENALIFQEVKRSETRLKTLFEDLPEGIFECDGEGRIVQMNRAGANILGFHEPTAPVGTSIDNFRLLSPNARAIRKRLRKSKRTTVENLVGVALRKDGTPFLADITFRTEYNRRGSVLRTEGVFRDISRRAM